MNLLDDLMQARWSTAFKTYGNDHATLIGLLIDWWVSSGDNRWAMEAAPRIDVGGKGGTAQRACDGVLFEKGQALGLLEVEGMVYDGKIRNVGDFLLSNDEIISNCRFGIFLGYRTTAQGRGTLRHVEPLPSADWVEIAKEITIKMRGFEFILLGLDKEWCPEEKGPRTHNVYYQCHPKEVWGIRVKAGKAMKRQVLATIKS